MKVKAKAKSEKREIHLQRIIPCCHAGMLASWPYRFIIPTHSSSLHLLLVLVTVPPLADNHIQDPLVQRIACERSEDRVAGTCGSDLSSDHTQAECRRITCINLETQLLFDCSGSCLALSTLIAIRRIRYISNTSTVLETSLGLGCGSH